MGGALRLQEEVLRDVANALAPRLKLRGHTSFRAAANARLGFDKENGWVLLCHSLDLIGDCGMAIDSYRKGGLVGRGFGERLLKLTGVLTCGYQQGCAILQLRELFKVPGKKAAEATFRRLGLVRLRHMVAAHTVSFRDDGETVQTSFTISRPHLDQGELVILDDQNVMRTWDMGAAIDEYSIWAELHLGLVCHKAVKSVFRTERSAQESYLARLSAIGTMRS